MYNQEPKLKHSISVWLVLRIPETLSTQCGTHTGFSWICLTFLHCVFSLSPHCTHTLYLGVGEMSENSCMQPVKTTLALWSSMLIFFKRNAMSVRSKGHPVYKSSTESEEKVYRHRDKGTPYHHQQIIIKAWNLLVTHWLFKSSKIWEHVVFLDSSFSQW